MKQKTARIITWVLIVLLLAACLGAVAHFTNGFTEDFKTFYITVDKKDIMTSASNYQLVEGDPLEVAVKYTFAGSGRGYTVKVVPNKLPGKDFDFTVDGEVYSFQAETDLTAGFIIECEDDSFTIEPKGKLNEVMAAVYPNNEVSDLSMLGYNNMFLLVVGSNNGESTVTLAFSVAEGVTGIIVKPDHIYF